MATNAVAGFVIGVAALLGVVGAELLTATHILPFGADIKLLGKSFAGENRVLVMAAGSYLAK